MSLLEGRGETFLWSQSSNVYHLISVFLSMYMSLSDESVFCFDGILTYPFKYELLTYLLLQGVSRSYVPFSPLKKLRISCFFSMESTMFMWKLLVLLDVGVIIEFDVVINAFHPCTALSFTLNFIMAWIQWQESVRCLASFILLLLCSLSEDNWVIFQFLYYDVYIGCGDDVFSKSVNI